MRDEIDLFVKSCLKCGRVKQPNAYLKAPLKHVIAHELNDALVIDHIVPEKEGVTKRRNRYILTLTDLFTGYIVAVPCKTRESEETIRLILHHWALKFGYPREIVADNDPSFTSKFFNAVLAYFNIKPTHGTAYKCSSTSKVERANKRINTALRLTLTEKQLNDWDLYLNYVCFALNGLRSRHTGVTPNMLVFGRELNTPLNLTLNGEPVTFEMKSKKHGKAYELYRTVRSIVEKARRNAALSFQYADNTYNKNLKGPYFEEHEWCFTLVNCPTHKFAERWVGPYKICKKISDHLYVIELENGKEKVVNISKLKRYTPSKYTHDERMNPEVPEFTPVAHTSQSATTPQEEQTSEIGLEVTFQPVNCRQETPEDTAQTCPNPAPNPVIEIIETETMDGDWSVVDDVPASNESEMTREDDQHTTAINPPNPDPTGDDEEPRRYPTRSRTSRNPLQLLWGRKSYQS
jgi:transposase InsO family protein